MGTCKFSAFQLDWGLREVLSTKPLGGLSRLIDKNRLTSKLKIGLYLLNRASESKSEENRPPLTFDFTWI